LLPPAELVVFACRLSGTRQPGPALLSSSNKQGPAMNSVIYIVGLVVVVAAILSFFGLR
jgi:hypothetical protein